MPPLAKEIARLMRQREQYASLGEDECIIVWAISWAVGTAGAVQLFEQAQRQVHYPLVGESPLNVGRAAIRERLQER